MALGRESPGFLLGARSPMQGRCSRPDEGATAVRAVARNASVWVRVFASTDIRATGHIFDFVMMISMQALAALPP